MMESSRVVVDLEVEVGISYLDGQLYHKLERRRAAGVLVPGIAELRAALERAAGLGPIPARVSKGKSRGTNTVQDDYLRIYVLGRYAVMLNVTNNGRGYLIGDVYPLRMRDQDEIVRGGFALKARAWRVYDHPGSLPLQLDSHWPAVKRAWAGRPAPAGARGGSRLPASHARYLDGLELIVDKAREIEFTSTSADRVCRYQRITPAAVRRRSAQSVHKFQLMGESRLSAGMRIHLDGHPDLRGVVTQIRESLITVTFDAPVDFNRIPQLGAFVASPNTTAFDKQAEAIELLREGRSSNPRLLDALVSHVFQPSRPATVMPRETLDDSQRAAFQMALAVPELALIQGPPGTGKTRTIKQVVWAHAVAAADRSGASPGAGAGGAVLVSAYTNQAVDNVLVGLPDDLTIIRVGAGVTPGAAHLSLESQAASLQQRILDRTGSSLARYAAADPVDGVAPARLREFDGERARVDAAALQVSQTTTELDKRDAEITAPLRARLSELASAVAGWQTAVVERGQAGAMAGRRQARAVKWAALPLLGLPLRGLAARRTAEAAAATAAIAEAANELDAVQRGVIAINAELAQVRAADKEHTRLSGCLRHERQRQKDAEARAVAAAIRLRECLAAFPADLLVVGGGLRPVPDDVDAAADLAALLGFRASAGAVVGLAQRRLSLLREWQAVLGRRTEQLYPELIRYADVVGATCIGAASSKYLGDVTFDLAIVDEAGQIGTTNLIVPLARARRSVLVGDHVQLPPYAELELANWARGEGDELHQLVTRSAFELLFPAAPTGSKTALNIQRRMPRAIGEFISAQFYGGRLGTDTSRPARDELFASPIAFIDMGELPASARRERRPRRDEPWPDTSYVNDAEARLVASLVAWYDARGSDWVVIAPFAAQVGRVTGLLAETLGDLERVAARVASIDSFQGGEHDTVIFGFSRSNSAGSVGFLSDTRRSNVAFSRARQRLIMVGDLGTLLNAKDPGFRAMMQELHAHLRRRGDLRGYREVEALLAGERG